MSKLTLAVPSELKAIMERHPAIPWNRVAARALWSQAQKVQLADRLASRSALTEDAAVRIGRQVKAGLRRRYTKGPR
jgi:hypothetical protein